LRAQVVGALGKTVLLVTHDLLEAEEICDRVAIMARGMIVAAGEVRQVLAQVRAAPPCPARAG
ncbi:MAG: ABC transporter ATP-binding protein, partial [Nitrospinae bacterium]|nr:ABC transporter ATP-binding protein [Nitrospinota bacterium]